MRWFGALLAFFSLTSAVFAQEEPKADSPKTQEPKASAPAGRGERLKQLRERFSGGGGETEGLAKKTWTVDGVERTALVYLPKKEAKSDAEAKALPVIFVFHGHGGGSMHVASRFALHKEWPEAIVVYPQGLPTPAPVVDPEGKRNGWQKYIGDQADRDLKFFDAMLATLKKEQKVDEKRIYSAGHSNGGFFSYTLAAARPEVLAAIAPVAGTMNLRDLPQYKPIPIFHVAGEGDPIVKFASQERSLEQARKINGCAAEGKKEGEFCTRYASEKGAVVVTYIHSGGHEIPREAVPKIAEFFKGESRK
jgi:polyhydroxybutyrate depolymerase